MSATTAQLASSNLDRNSDPKELTPGSWEWTLSHLAPAVRVEIATQLRALDKPTALEKIVATCGYTAGAVAAVAHDLQANGELSLSRETVAGRHQLVLTTPPRPPAPIEVPCRPATEDEIPGGARTLIKAAEAGGWTVLVTYAKAEVASLAVRMQHPGGHRAVALWVNGKSPQAWFALTGTYWRAVKVNDLKAAIK